MCYFRIPQFDKMLVYIWTTAFYFLLYRISSHRVHADGRIYVQFQLWEPPDFRPESVCCPSAQSSALVPSQSNISHSPRPCRTLCDLYADPILTVIVRLLRRKRPQEPAKSWTVLMQTVFHQSDMNPTDQWVEHQRELTSATESSHTTANYVNQSTSDAVPHLVLRVRLECEQYFYGLDCGQFCQPMRGPHGNFICDPETGTQQCLPGWTGERCTQAICDPPCKHGTCVRPNYCKCRSGWQGDACDQCQVYPGCVHGNCERNVTTALPIPFTCECQQGWGGMLCDVDLQFCQRHEMICENGGLCVNTRSRSELFHRCVCPAHFFGRHCEKRVTGCVLEGCEKHGTCVHAPNGTLTCQCHPGFCGIMCELEGEEHCPSTTENPETSRPLNSDVFTLSSTHLPPRNCNEETCMNGGSCEVQPDSGQLICHCPPGFTGIQCDEIMSGNITDEYPSPDLEEQTSNQTQPIPLNSLTFLSNVYRSSLMLFLLTFVLLLCVAILAHCIRSYHHHQTKPRYVHQSQLTYPHIANNLSAEIVRNPMHANYEEKALHSLDWTRSERAQTVTVFSSKCTPNLDKVLLIQNVFKSKYPPLPESYPTSDNMFNGFATRSGCRAQSKPQLTGWFSGQIRPFTIRLSLPSQPDRSSSV